MKIIFNYIKQNITAKLVISLVLFTLIFTVIIAFVQSKNAYNEYLTEKEDYISFLHDAYAKSILQNAYDINTEKIDLIAEGIINSGKVDYVKITEFKDTAQQLILTEKGSESNFGDTLKLSYNQIIPETKAQQHIQWVLHSHKVSFNNFLAQSVFAFILNTLLILLPLALIIYLLMYRTVISHVKKVAEYTKNFNINEKTRPALKLSRFKVFAPQNDEIDILQKSINNLISGIIKYSNEKNEFAREIIKTNRLLNSAQRLTSTGGWTFDVQKNKMYWTQEVYHIHGIKTNSTETDSAELIDKSVECYLENDRKKILEAFQNCIEKGITYEMDFQFIDFQKKNKWIRTGAEPIYENNEITAVLGYISDITKKKERANELKLAIEKAEESEKLLSRSQDMAHIGSWKLDLAANKLTWSDETYRIFGCKPQEFTATYEAFLGFIHPDDRAAVDEAYSGSLREGTDSYEIEHRIVLRSKEDIRHVYERCIHVRDDAGAIIQSIGMIQDITEQKNAEEFNRKSAERAKMQRNLIAQLTFEESIVNSSIDDALKILTPKLAANLQVDRVSVWLLSENEKKLQRRMLYDAASGLHSQIDVLNTAEIPSYFEALQKYSQVDADDAQNDPRTKELTDDYFIPLKISSLLDSAIQQDGRLIGVLSAEHRGSVREWQTDEKSFLTAVTNLVAQLFANAERKLAEEDLIRMSRIMQNAQEIAHLGSFEYVAASQTTIWSEEEYRIYGLNPDGPSPEYNEMLEKCIHPDDAKLLHDAFMTAMQNQGVYELEHRIVRPDGSVRWVYDKAHPYFDQNGNLLRYVGATLDITERKGLQQELEILNADLEKKVEQRTVQLEASNKELEAFSYSVSHDLRAPLRHISGYVDLLNQRYRDLLPEKARHYLKTISGASSQMGILIDDMLQYSRTGRKEISKTELDLNILLKEVMKELNTDIKEREITWSIQKLPRVLGDYNLLKLVWTNLLDNAVKYTRNQQMAKISVSYKEKPKDFVFCVCDNGVGFDMKYAHKLFGVFQRLHSQTEFEGTGIGLANVQRIIHKHLGSAWVEAEPGNGAKFYFSLPINREDIS